jgi:hypothetical protein
LAEAAAERATVYSAALEELQTTEGWAELGESVQREIAAPLHDRAGEAPEGSSLAMLRENTLACSGILKSAIERVLRSIPGTEPDFVIVSEMIRGPITSEEQLDAALEQIRDRCLKSIADGTSVILT